MKKFNKILPFPNSQKKNYKENSLPIELYQKTMSNRQKLRNQKTIQSIYRQKNKFKPIYTRNKF